MDANPPKELEKKVEDFLKTQRPRRHDHVPMYFVGKGGHGYMIKNWIAHRGWGAAKVSRNFKDAVRLTGTAGEHKLTP